LHISGKQVFYDSAQKQTVLIGSIYCRLTVLLNHTNEFVPLLFCRYGVVHEDYEEEEDVGTNLRLYSK